MNRQQFEALSFEEQIAYMNERPKMTLKQIAETIEEMPASSLSQLFTKQGYNRVKGIYVMTYDTPQETPSNLHELLQFKDQLIAVLKEQQPRSTLDFSVLEQFGHRRRSFGFDIPVELAKEIERFIKVKGFKKQAVFSLAIYEFMQRHG